MSHCPACDAVSANPTYAAMKCASSPSQLHISASYLSQSFPLQSPFTSQLSLSQVFSCMAALFWQPNFFLITPKNKAEGSFWSNILELSLYSDSFYACMKINTLYITTASTICSFYCGSRPHLLICDISHIFLNEISDAKSELHTHYMSSESTS